MTRWEYAMFYDVAGLGADDGVRFTRDQGPNLVPLARTALGRGLEERDSTSTYLHVNMKHTTEIAVMGVLGGWGWEVVAGTPTATNRSDRVWVFKREVT